MAPIAVGNKIPDATLMYLDDDNRGQIFNLHEKLKGRKAVLIGVPGAFTPTWSQKHIPSLIELSEEIKSKGVSDIIVISVNDQYVMKAWERSFDGGEQLKFLADGSAEFTKALDLDLDLSEKGMGQRSRQYSLVVTDLVVETVNLDEGGLFADIEEFEGRQRGAGKEGGQFDDFEEGEQSDFDAKRLFKRADPHYLLAFVIYEEASWGRDGGRPVPFECDFLHDR